VPRAAPYVVGKLRALDVAIVETAPRLRPTTKDKAAKDQIDDEAVHDLRVAIRRMRTLLKMSRALFGPWHTDAVRAAFAEVMRATGELRDEEVLEETLEGAASGTEYAGWLRQRKPRETKLRRALATRIDRGDLDRARLMLKALLVFPIDPERDVELARFARRTVERARRKVERRRDAHVSDVTGMHDLRIAYKELRYSIELLSDALPIDARALLEPATVFQKRLGELHDVDVAIEVIQKAKGLTAPAREEALGSLGAMREKRVAKYLRELDPLSAEPPPRPASARDGVVLDSEGASPRLPAPGPGSGAVGDSFDLRSLTHVDPVPDTRHDVTARSEDPPKASPTARRAEEVTRPTPEEGRVS
jgi:CHAD domain-containing protein